MALQVFKNKNVPTWAENEFFKYLIEEFRNTNLDIGLFFNVFIEGTEIDTLIVSEKGLFIIEYKNYSGKLYASENGNWKISKLGGQEVTINQGRENVFQQLRRQRFSLMNLIKTRFTEIFHNSSLESKSMHHIGSYLLFEDLDPESQIDISDKAKIWLTILSKNKISDDFYHKRPSNLTFKRDEIINLSTVLKMELVQINDANLNELENVICPVCLYSTNCDKKFLSGEVLNIENRNIRLRTEDNIYNIYYNKKSILDNPFPIQRSDDTELKILDNIFDHFHNLRTQIPIMVNFFHLMKSEGADFEITSDTLIIIFPSWLYSVTSFANLDFCERNVLTKKFAESPSNKHIIRGNAVNESLGSILESPDNLDNAINKSKEYIKSQEAELIANEIESAELESKVETEINTIADWAADYNLRSYQSTEEFIISTKLGLKGKIDLILKDDNDRIVDIIELKSSKPDYNTGQVKEYHELQVTSYGIMVLLKQGERFQDIEGETPSVIYSGAEYNIRKPARFDSQIFAKVFKYRNILLNSEFSLILPDPYPHPMQYPNGCQNCGAKFICMDLCRIIQPEYCDETCFKHPANFEIFTSCSLQNGITENFRKDFIEWINILNEIRIINHNNYSGILLSDNSENLKNGKILEIKDFPKLLSSTDTYFLYELIIKNGNFSEFREFDLIILTDNYDIEKGSLNIGVIKKLSFESCQIQTKQKLRSAPKFIFPYYPDSLEFLNYVGLYKGFFNKSKLFRLLYNEMINDLLSEINIELLQGVPGSGKTTEIVNRIIEYSNRDEKVFVATFTNKAIDNIHQKLLAYNPDFNNRIYRFGNVNRYEETTSDDFDTSDDYHDIELLETQINNKTIFLSTLHSANSELITKLSNYEHVIIDEASQISIPMAFVPMSLANDILLVGDHFQLPPIFPEEILKEESYINKLQSIFELIWKNTENILPANKRRSLTTQFRMVKEIAAFPSKSFYSDTIQMGQNIDSEQTSFIISFNDQSSSSNLFEILDPKVPSVWVQVLNDTTADSNRSNDKEAELCARIVSDFIGSGVQPKNISIISPFRLQVNNIKNKIHNNLRDTFEDLSIDTIDRFQGSQSDIIIISLCSSGNNNFLVKDLRRFNVALTRARFKRIILGDINSFKKEESEHHSLIHNIINDGFTKLISAESFL